MPSSTQREGTFYPVWPYIEGKPLSLQWGEIRANTSEMKALVNNAWLDVQDNVNTLNALKELSGYNFGEQSFRNKYRIFYNKTSEQLCIYRNKGTVDIPDWEEVWCIRFHDGQFQVVSEGGIQSNAGFYGPIPRQLEVIGEVAGDTEFINPSKLFFNSEHGFYLTELKSGSHKGAPVVNYAFPFGRSKTYTASGKEWIITHQFGVSPVLVQTMDDHDRVVIPDQIDVSDPNTAYFYFHASTTGKAIIATGGTGAVELVPRDPFYLVVRTTAEDASDKKMAPNAELIFDDADFYVKVNLDSPSGTRKRANVAFKRDTRVEFTDSENVNLSSKLSFNNTYFYLSSDSEGKPVLNVDGDALITTIDHGSLAGLSDDDHTQYTRTDGTRTFTGNQSMGGNKLINLGAPTADADAARFQDLPPQFYLTVKQTNDQAAFKDINTLAFESDNFYLTQNDPNTDEVIVNLRSRVTDHGQLTGLNDDDHTQYTLVNGTRAFSGDQSMGGNKLTNLAEPTSDADAARLQDIPPGFYGPTIKQTDDEAVFKRIQVIAFETSNFYLTQNDPNTDEAIINLRSRVTDHGELTGLSDDDHTQYLLTNGTRAMSGNLDMGSNAITNVGNVDGVDVSSHASRHDVGGADALSTVPDHDHTGDVGDGNTIDHGALTGKDDDDHTQYILEDGTRAFSGDQSMGSNKLTNLGEPTADSDAARLQDIPPGFYGLTVKQTDDIASFKNIKVLAFESDNFYITQNEPNTDEVIISSREAQNQDIDFFTFDLPTGEDQKVWLDTHAIIPYNVEGAHIVCESGSVKVGFYIKELGQSGDGVSIQGMDPINVTTTMTHSSPVGLNSVSISDEFIMAVFSSNNAVHLRGTVRIRKV